MALQENEDDDSDSDDKNKSDHCQAHAEQVVTTERAKQADQSHNCDNKSILIKSGSGNSSSSASKGDQKLEQKGVRGAQSKRPAHAKKLLSRRSRSPLTKSLSSVELEDSSETSDSSSKSEAQIKDDKSVRKEREKLQKVAATTRWFHIILNGIRSTNLQDHQEPKTQDLNQEQHDTTKENQDQSETNCAEDVDERNNKRNLKINILKNLSSSHSDSGRRIAQDAHSRESLPSFGETRIKLQRLPYYTYQGRAKNVKLISASDRPYKNKNFLELSSSSASIDSSRSSTFSFNQFPREKPNIIQQTQKNFAASKKQRELRSRGYSNISNLFPEKPVPIKRNDHRQSHSRSLLNLNELTDPPKQIYNNITRRQQQQQYQQFYRYQGFSTMRRHNSLLGGQAGNGGAATIASSANQANPKLNAGSARPASVSGNYGPGGGGGGTQAARQHRRSPSAGSLHYGIPSANNNSTNYPYGRGAYAPDFQDPDCPVHGVYDQYQEKSLVDSAGPISPQLDTESPYGYPLYGSRRRGPAYYESGTARDRGYLGGRVGPTYASAYSLYSPTSPMESSPNGRAPSAAVPPYYDRDSRFSVYQRGSGAGDPSAAVAGGLYKSRQPSSILAPPKEQVRRILGYPAPLKPVHLHPQWAYSRPFHHLLPSGVEWTQPNLSQHDNDPDNSYYIDYDDDINQLNASLLRFSPFNKLEDTQAIRAVDFHPSGQVYAIGSNSRALRICAYPAPSELNSFGSSLLAGVTPNSASPDTPTEVHHHPAQSPRVLFKFLQVHRGSIYCVKFNKTGQLLATGSNDQTVHIVRYNSRTHSPEGDEYRLTMHDGTVRDLCFIDDATSGNSLLISAGGGDNKIYVTDCDTITPFQSFAGHTSMVMGLHHLGGASFVSCSQDRTIRFWDLRTRQCTSIVSAPPSRQNMGGGGAGVGVAGSRYNSAAAGPGAPVCAVQADHSGRLLVSGHTDSTCMLYDIRGSRIIQAFKPHEDEIRTVSFSPKSYYLLTGAYDGRIVLSDLQGDLNQPLPSVCVAESDDKIIQSCWHPTDFTFVTTSANKTATLWVPPTDTQ